MITADLKRRLWQRFSRDHVVLFEVPIDGHKVIVSPGDGELHEVLSRQSIDAVAVGMWRSTGHEVLAFEVKATVSDLVSELSHPIKSRAAMMQCDRFYLVLPTRAMLVGLTIPPSWGVMVMRREGLEIARRAQRAGGALGRRFVADLVGAAVNRVHDPAVAVPRVAVRRRRRRYR